MAEEFKTLVGGKFALLTILENTSADVDIDDVISTFNKAMMETVNEILSEHHSKKKPRITTDILNLCGERRKWEKVQRRC